MSNSTNNKNYNDKKQLLFLKYFLSTNNNYK